MSNNRLGGLQMSKKLSFKELVAVNKQLLLNDKKAMEDIEKKIEEKALQTSKN